MRLIDEQYTATPFFGIRQMTSWLKRPPFEEDVNHKRIRRLMQLMGLEALCPKPGLSKPSPMNKIYPYLLKGLNITKPNQVWATDITYIRLRRGFVYLAAILDWFSRYVVSWEISITLTSEFCIAALDRALMIAQPGIFNSDQGAQFTSSDFTARLLQKEIRISMDGRGRAFDNIFVERLWRSVKHEDIYLNDYETVPELIGGLRKYFQFYNNDRPHQALGNRSPAEVYWN